LEKTFFFPPKFFLGVGKHELFRRTIWGTLGDALNSAEQLKRIYVCKYVIKHPLHPRLTKTCYS
jgi:hypothetical protein